MGCDCCCSYLAAKTPFFVACFHLTDLRQRSSDLLNWCQGELTRFGYDTSTGYNPGTGSGFYQDACNVPEYGPKPGSTKPDQGASIPCGNGVSVMDQCMAEQKWMRESMLRSLLYVQACLALEPACWYLCIAVPVPADTVCAVWCAQHSFLAWLLPPA